MIIKDNKIVEITEEELFNVYLRRGYDDLWSFTDYAKFCEFCGTHIIREGDESSE